MPEKVAAVMELVKKAKELYEALTPEEAAQVDAEMEKLN